MDIIKAFELLEIEYNSNNLSHELLQKQYHVKALHHHPDKNGNTLESTIKFREINEAYILLSSLFTVEEMSENEEKKRPENEEKETCDEYVDLLNAFIIEFANKKYLDVLKDIIVNCSYKIFETLSKSYSMEIYHFLSKNKYIFHITQEVLTHVLEIIHTKEIQNIIINPSIDDLFENNIYKLTYKNALYLVPLWHHEVYFDEKPPDIESEKIVDEFMVTCKPILQNNMVIDEDNNMIVYIEVLFEFGVLHKKSIDFHLGKKEFCVPIKDLFLQQTQTFVFKNQGISKIKDEIDNVEEKSDIVAVIRFV